MSGLTELSIQTRPCVPHLTECSPGEGQVRCHVIIMSLLSSLYHHHAMITVQGNRMAAASCHQYLDPVTAIVSIKDISNFHQISKLFRFHVLAH